MCVSMCVIYIFICVYVCSIHIYYTCVRVYVYACVGGGWVKECVGLVVCACVCV